MGPVCRAGSDDELDVGAEAMQARADGRVHGKVAITT
jgi:hypothetical protein